MFCARRKKRVERRRETKKSWRSVGHIVIERERLVHSSMAIPNQAPEWEISRGR
jgi:hypothetical protein